MREIPAPERRELGTRYKNLSYINKTKHQGYDYRQNGILVKYLPRIISESPNPITSYVLSWVDGALIWVSGYIDSLRHFKNYRYKL